MYGLSIRHAKPYNTLSFNTMGWRRYPHFV
jgi:hypothetical protein